ncbi:MAG: PTS sugar transporter subunit IIA [Anaerostipes sp.]|nr:PTS sugar transporter subunit IIA [Anaerostipes sp.]MDD4370668.1 PTS sugar transporter subunit IIA [Anaerostipes sp.]
MKREMIHKELIQLDMEVVDQKDFFEKMADKLETLGYVKSTFKNAIMEREAEFPTALAIEPFPVAIPHADPQHIIKPFIAATRLKQSVKWCEMAANDQQHDVKFIFMLGFKRSDEHVELLQVLVQNFQRKELMETLESATSVEDYMNAILSMEGM